MYRHLSFLTDYFQIIQHSHTRIYNYYRCDHFTRCRKIGNFLIDLGSTSHQQKQDGKLTSDPAGGSGS